MPIQTGLNLSSTQLHRLLCCLLGAILIAGCGGQTITATSLVRIQPGDGDKSTNETYKRTQAQLLNSAFVLRTALRSPEVSQLSTLKDLPSPVEWLEKHIKTKSDSDSEILKVSLQCRDADDAIAIVDAVVCVYLDEIAQAERNDRAERLYLLRATHRQALRNLQELLDDINTIGGEFGDPESSLGKINQEFKLETLTNQSDQIATLKSEMLFAKVDLKVYQELVNGQTGPSAAATNMKIKESTSRYAVLKAEVEELSDAFTLARESLRTNVVFSAELETKKLEAETLRKRVASLAEQIHQLELAMGRKPRVQLIQTADTKKDDD